MGDKMGMHGFYMSYNENRYRLENIVLYEFLFSDQRIRHLFKGCSQTRCCLWEELEPNIVHYQQKHTHNSLRAQLVMISIEIWDHVS